MKSLFVLISLFLLTLTACIRPPAEAALRDVPDNEREVFVVNELAETITVINPATLTAYQNVIATRAWPKDIILYGETLYVVNSGANSISRYNEDTFESEGDIYIGKSTNPWTMVIKPGSDVAYVPCFVAGTVAIVNLVNGTVVKTVDVGTGPEGAAYVNGKLYVCNTAWDTGIMGFREGTVSVIDGATDTIATTITVGTNPQSAYAFPAQGELHVVCSGVNGGPDADDGRVFVIDVSNDTVTTNFFVGGSPSIGRGSVDEEKETAYLVGVGGLSSYNYRTKNVYHSSSNYIIQGNDIANDLYAGVSVDTVNNVLFVSDFTHDRVLVLSRDDYSIVKEIAGSDGPGVPALLVE